MSMKKLLETMENLTECPPMEGPVAAPTNPGNPVTMNISLNASGKDHVADLINMMKNAGLQQAQPAAAAIMPMRTDMERLRGIVDKPEMEADDAYAEVINDEENLDESMDAKSIIRQRTIELARKANVSMKNVNLDKVYKFIEQRKSLGKGPVNQQPEKIEKLIEYYQNMAFKANPNYNDRVMDLIYDKVVEMVDEVAPMIHGSNEAYDNEPNPEYRDHKYMTKDLSGGLNREKKAYAAAQDGDNAMAVETIKASLMAALTEKKAKPDFPDIDNDGDTKEPMKKAAKDAGKGKGSKPKKGQVPPQFKKK